jgi:thioredoxin-dependent adenylylsulfate APS reductase
LQDLSESEETPAADLIAWAIRTYRDRFAIAVSFQKEGMAIVDMAWRLARDVHVFTLETGRLPEETERMMETVRERYGIVVERVRPEADEVRQMVARHGANLFRDSVELRRLCCEVRKVRPLERKLKELQAWATGLRREQSPERAGVPKLERQDGRIKINPLADWTDAQVEEYIRRRDVPVHPLYARGFASIGCEPCTRALLPGETGRAGRWWWERDSKKECGIHVAPEGVVRRAADPRGRGMLTDTNA